MRFREILTELTFAGSRCTKDCSGHKAGYMWGAKTGASNAVTASPSFNKGVDIANNLKGTKKTPKIRNSAGKFTAPPKVKKP